MASRDPFDAVKAELQTKVNKLQQDYTRWSAMRIANPMKPGLGDSLARDASDVLRTLNTMDRAVDKAEHDPARFGLNAADLSRRRQWTQDARAHVTSIQHSIDDTSADFTAIAIPGNAALHSHVTSAQQQTQSVLESQDQELENIEAAADRIKNMGLDLNSEIREQRTLLEQVDTETDGVRTRLAASRQRLEAVLAKTGIKGQCTIIVGLSILIVVLLVIALS